MFFVLSKTVGLLINPLVILLVLFLIAFFSRTGKVKKAAYWLLAILSILFTNTAISNTLLRWWEIPAIAYQEIKGTYDVAIVLSGVTSAGKSPKDRVHIHRGADRIMHTVQLYKLGKTEKILVSGGFGIPEEGIPSEAERIKRVLLLSGVPEQDIWLEENSRNTHENAVNSKELLDQKKPNGRYLLATSAFHMRRALASFEKAGLAVQPFSTDVYATSSNYNWADYFIPSPAALFNWGSLLREWAGLLSYKLSGYA